MVTMFYSFTQLPLADAVALNYAAPLFVALFSAFILKEVLDIPGYVAMIVGFVGMLVMVQPGHGGGVSIIGGINGIAGALFSGFAMVGVRALGRTEHATTTVFYFTALSVAFTVFPMPWVWRTPDLKGFISLAVTGIFAGLAQYFMTRAFQYAQAAVISPFGYVSIFWAAIFGYFIWNEIPGWTMYIGGSVVIVAGLYLLHRETYKFRVIPETSKLSDPIPVPAL